MSYFDYINRGQEDGSNYYVYLIEYVGNDSNDGRTPQTAVATMNRAVTILNDYTGTKRRYLVSRKHKFYNEAITVSRTSTKPITFDFVAGAIIDGSGNSKLRLTVLNDYLINAVIISYPTISGILGGIVQLGANSVFSYNFISCKIIDSQISGDVGTSGMRHILNFTKCTINNCYLSYAGATNNVQSFNFNGSVIYNSRSTLARTQLISVVNSIIVNTNITLYDYPNAIIKLDFCNILNSTLSSKNNTQLQADGFNLNGISSDPKLQDVANNIFTLKSDSPCLYAGENKQHIGISESNYLTAQYLYENAVTIINLQLINNVIVRTTEDSDSYLQTGIIDLGAARIVSIFELVATLSFSNDSLVSTVDIEPQRFPNWNSEYNYMKGSTVTYNSVKYKSLVNNNMTIEPDSDIESWEVSAQVPDFLTVYFRSGLSISQIESKLYELTEFNTDKSLLMRYLQFEIMLKYN